MKPGHDGIGGMSRCYRALILVARTVRHQLGRLVLEPCDVTYPHRIYVAQMRWPWPRMLLPPHCARGRHADQSAIWVAADNAAAIPGAQARIGFPATAPPAMNGLTAAPASARTVRAAATSQRLICSSTYASVRPAA